MAMRTLDLTQPIKGYDGKVVMENDTRTDGDGTETTTSKVITLRQILITYLMQAGQMGLSDEQQLTLHNLGFSIGGSDAVVTLSGKEWDTLKAMCDKPKATNAQGQVVYSPINLVLFQVKDMVDNAPSLEIAQSPAEAATTSQSETQPEVLTES